MDWMADIMMYASGLFDIFGDQNTIPDMAKFRAKVEEMGAQIYHQRGKKGIRIHCNGETIPRDVINFVHSWAHKHELNHAFGPFSPEDIADPEPIN